MGYSELWRTPAKPKHNSFNHLRKAKNKQKLPYQKGDFEQKA
jgi:hypothetical protein